MFTDLHVETGPMIDTAVEFETTAVAVDELAQTLQEKRTDFMQSSAGAASSAAAVQMQKSIDELIVRAGKLKRNATVMRNLVALYDQTDLDGARAFGG